MTRARKLAVAQSAYLVATGVWPLLHRASFERVTGEKEDFWLVRTVGGLAAAAGLSLGMSAARGRRTREASALALTTGLVFAIADVRASLSESPVYLGDLVLQAAFVPAWTGPWE